MRTCCLILALYFGLLSLAPQWLGLEFFKLDALLEHYAQFQQEKEQDGFWSFVQEHYLQQVNDKQQEHRELPFKSVQSNTLVTLFMPVKSPAILLEKSFIDLSRQNILSAPTSVTINDFFEFWHPPQLV
ncbi:MAG: hypothetical protein NWS92_08375 [Crocinitomicaceae bacterium]|nr:hypothetical protein [Crocinitomicaceae bacterium]MDP4723195.1 hypothetical protein [Crocinitomicaceae bacterium]MDP4740037.1 hypothetical protein [Crocinitomicaceae bacterium]MDP4799853.1 hypothetical protein [Crocinitomicaceae bacterium]MDP4807406.1 hypothetical protein [Crocinitomicaceae bacterium]